MDIHRNKVTDFINYLERAGIIGQLRDQTKGIRALGKVEKIYLGNTNLIYLLSEGTPDIGNIRESLFFSQMSVMNDVISSKVADFTIADSTFEVGGKGKGQRQIDSVESGYIVKDDIEWGYGNVVPL
ncbi:MAG: hypothetical protein R3Y16_04955 [Rikenellaceae bacterium]